MFKITKHIQTLLTAINQISRLVLQFFFLILTSTSLISASKVSQGCNP